MLAPSTKLTIAAAAICSVAMFPADASAQYGNYGGYGSYGRGMNRTAAGGVSGAAFIRGYSTPYSGYGYGGYGGYYGYAPTLLYRSPSSFNRTDDPWEPESHTSALKRSMQRFRERRESSRRHETQYSNETYKRNYPFDQFYYERMMTP